MKIIGQQIFNKIANNYRRKNLSSLELKQLEHPNFKKAIKQEGKFNLLLDSPILFDKLYKMYAKDRTILAVLVDFSQSANPSKQYINSIAAEVEKKPVDNRKMRNKKDALISIYSSSVNPNNLDLNKDGTLTSNEALDNLFGNIHQLLSIRGICLFAKNPEDGEFESRNSFLKLVIKYENNKKYSFNNIFALSNRREYIQRNRLFSSFPTLDI